MKLVLIVLALFSWILPQQISEVKAPAYPIFTGQLESTVLYQTNAPTDSFTKKSVASHRKMNHRRSRSKPF